MNKIPIVVPVHTKPIHELSQEAIEHFRNEVVSGNLPSKALRNLMQTYPDIDAGVVINLITYSYPDAYITSRFNMPLLDSNYPQCRQDVFSDQDFDNAVKALLER